MARVVASRCAGRRRRRSETEFVVSGGTGNDERRSKTRSFYDSRRSVVFARDRISRTQTWSCRRVTYACACPSAAVGRSRASRFSKRKRGRPSRCTHTRAERTAQSAPATATADGRPAPRQSVAFRPATASHVRRPSSNKKTDNGEHAREATEPIRRTWYARTTTTTQQQQRSDAACRVAAETVRPRLR